MWSIADQSLYVYHNFVDQYNIQYTWKLVDNRLQISLLLLLLNTNNSTSSQSNANVRDDNYVKCTIYVVANRSMNI